MAIQVLTRVPHDPSEHQGVKVPLEGMTRAEPLQVLICRVALVWIHVTRTFPQGKSCLAKDVSEHLIHLTVISFFYMNELTL